MLLHNFVLSLVVHFSPENRDPILFISSYSVCASIEQGQGGSSKSKEEKEEASDIQAV